MPDKAPETAPDEPQPVAEPAAAGKPVKPKSDLSGIKSAWWKRALWWILGILAAVGVFVGIILALKGSKKASNAANQQVAKAKAQIAKADLEATIKIAEARNEEKAVIDKLKEIRNIDDEEKQAQELADLL